VTNSNTRLLAVSLRTQFGKRLRQGKTQQAVTVFR
jgi:hypothetical protein